MLENIKVDVIYHNTGSDFEMEFNLCGCCRMRLLSDKTSDKKAFINALRKAVSRSRVIIICGPLFSEEGLISTVAAAVSRKLEICNNSTYGINSDEEIKIIKGAVPLVTSSGYFGGCIIESGPQTIVLLTENRSFRKEIMKNLIHPYVEELSLLAIRESRTVAKPTVPQETVAPQEKAAPQETVEPQQVQPTPQPEPIQFEGIVSEEIKQPEINENQKEEPVKETENTPFVSQEDDDKKAPIRKRANHNIEFIMDGEDEEEEEESPFIEDIRTQYRSLKGKYYSELMEKSQKEKEPEPKKEKSKKKDKNHNSFNIVIIFVLLLVLAIITLAYLVVIRPYIMGVPIADYINEIFSASSSNNAMM